MPTDAPTISEIVKTAMNEMPRHHPPIQRSLVLRTLAIDATPLNHRSLACVQIGDVPASHAVPTHKVIVPTIQASRKHQATLRPVGLVGRSAQEIADGAQTILVARLDQFKLPDEGRAG